MRVSRIFAIIQLCIIFSALLMTASYPFLGAFFELRKETLLYQFILGKGDLISKVVRDNSEKQEQLLRNRERFLHLPEQEQETINQNYAALLKKGERSFWGRCQESIWFLLFGFSPLMRGWLLLSFIGALMVLLEKPQTLSVLFLSFLLSVAMVTDSYWHPSVQKEKTADLPSEQELLSRDGRSSLPKELQRQMGVLQKSWEHYLIRDWAHEEPSLDKELYSLQKEKGEYLFELNRLHHLLFEKNVKNSSQSASLLPALLAFFWSFLLCLQYWQAGRLSKHLKKA